MERRSGETVRLPAETPSVAVPSGPAHPGLTPAPDERRYATDVTNGSVDG